MPSTALLLLVLAATPPDTVSAVATRDSVPAVDTVQVHAEPAATRLVSPASRTSMAAPAPATVWFVADTTPRRRRAIEVSDAYATRLRIHHYASYALIPLFAAQSIAGNQMYQSGGSDPRWASDLHGIGAGGLAALFTVNTVTGVWNLWDSRAATQGRTVRWVHSGLMLASDAGFTYAGVKLGPEATRSGTARREHRRIAMISMGGALLGYATMLFGTH
jgi:hypothetical protein